ncbi:MAG TPA: hypothetical protein EYP55_02375 [Anaerolineae bacterium]|nr:hypothetical protein [Anaerolineae bacterium]
MFLVRHSVSFVDKNEEKCYTIHIKAHHPIAYADAFAVALSQREDATLVTGDPEPRHVESLITIEWLPQG